MLPEDVGTKPMMALNSVDLPEPLTPTSAAMVPRGSSNDASRKAVWPLRYVTVMLWAQSPVASFTQIVLPQWSRP